MERNNFSNTVNKNLPGICTVGSIIAQVTTAGLAFYEGFKFAHDWAKLPEGATTKDKVKVVARRVVPVVLSCGTGCGLTYAAYAESS